MSASGPPLPLSPVVSGPSSHTETSLPASSQPASSPDEEQMDEELAAESLLQTPHSSTTLRRKRARPRSLEPDSDRSDTGTDHDTKMIQSAPASKAAAVRDHEYYLSDGSCVLLVENVLFNVHRSTLSRDSSSFGTMFSLPQGEAIVEGTSDDHPIVLHGDKVEEFRHLLWALYALPHELMLVHTSPTNLPRLINIARLSNKYSFKSLETWSLDVIVENVTRKPSTIPPQSTHPLPINPHFASSSSPFSTTSASTPSPTATHSGTSPHGSRNPIAHLTENTDQIVALVRLAQLCGHEKLLNTMVDNLKKLVTSSLESAYIAMTLAEELDLRQLRGLAYYELMDKPVAVLRPGPSHGAARLGHLDSKGRLLITPAQHLTLLTGFHALSTHWHSHLRLNPPTIMHSPTCGSTWHQHSCSSSWSDFWKEKVKCESVCEKGLADVKGRLRAMGREFERWGVAGFMHAECREAAKGIVRSLVGEMEDEDRLVRFFEGEVGAGDEGVA